MPKHIARFSLKKCEVGQRCKSGWWKPFEFSWFMVSWQVTKGAWIVDLYFFVDHHRCLGGGNSNIFYFHPETWGRFPIWRLHIFQMGWLKQPARCRLIEWIHGVLELPFQAFVRCEHGRGRVNDPGRLICDTVSFLELDISSRLLWQEASV